MMRILRFLRELVFPPRCAVCRERRAPSAFAEPLPVLCDACRTAWEQEMRRLCRDCFRESSRCRCMPRAMREAGYGTFVKAVFYGKDTNNRIARTLILHMKDHNRAATFAFCAGELLPELRATLQEAAVRAPDVKTVVTWLPRSPRTVRKVGHDQAKMLALAIADALGYPCEELLRRAHGGKTQKKLKATERRHNMSGLFTPMGNCRGLRVLVVDDLVTTGFGMAEAAKVLRASGAAEWISVAVGASPLEKAER